MSAELATLFPRLEVLWADGEYTGDFGALLQQALGWRLELVQHSDAGVRGFWVQEDEPAPVVLRRFCVLPRRWVVECTFAWLGHQRRLSWDYEYLPRTEGALIYAAMCRLLLKRLVV